MEMVEMTEAVVYRCSLNVKRFCKIYRKGPVATLFNKVASLLETRHLCFPVKLVKFFRKAF